MAGTRETIKPIHYIADALERALRERLARRQSVAVPRAQYAVRAEIVLSSQWLFQQLTQGNGFAADMLYLPAGEDRLFVGFGEADKVSVDRGRPMAELKRLVSDSVVNPTDEDSPALRWYGGFAFGIDTPGTAPWSDWPGAKFVLPVFHFEVRLPEGESLLWEPGQEDVQLPAVVTYVPHNPSGSPETAVEMLWRQWEQTFSEDSDPGREGRPASAAPSMDMASWVQAVNDIADAIGRQHLRKVVLARSQTRAVPAAGATAWLPRLLAADRSATVFAVAEDTDVFIGASPERLVDVRAGVARVDCLAGSRPRGQSSGEDEAYAAELLGSAKDQREHAVVVDWVRTRLAPFSGDLDIPGQPTLKRMKTVQHLHTPAAARLSGATVLDVALALHPTPAVAGDPVAKALEVIRSHEPVDRGWYAGAVGWIDTAGDGEFMVALRSALIQKQTAVLYAGAGIMADSDPQMEWQETGWKFRPMEQVLTPGEGDGSDG